MSKSDVTIIAEIGNSHEGSIGLAKQFIKIAADCGADVVKFQTHLFDAESLAHAPNPPYFKDESRQAYFNRTAFSLDQYKNLKVYSENECGIEFMSSPFSLEAVDVLEEVGVKRYKVPSGEVTNLPLLIKLAKTRKPVLLSSGMSSLTELDTAVNTLLDKGCTELTVLQCTSEYPCPPEQSGLNVITEFKSRYKLPVGYSDHTIGTAIPVAAVMLGASIIEKHFTLSQNMYGSDARNSTEPDEFKQLVTDIRAVTAALENPINKDDKAAELTTMKETFEKSVVASSNLKKGTVIQAEDLAFKKPGTGINASQFQSLIGKIMTKDISKDHLFYKSDFD